MSDLIDRQALLNEYDKAHVGPPGKARKLIEDAPAASPWHSTDEKPKDEGKYVAINVKTKWWYEASYENGNWKAVDLFGQRWVVIHPTHWMPVELPEEENK